MTTEQQKVLEQFDTSTIAYFLRQVRDKAFILWSTDDVIHKAAEIGFVMDEDTAIDIISDIDGNSDCNHGITWDTIDYHVGEWIDENSFNVVYKADEDSEEVEAKFCALETNDEIEEFWNDDDYYFYGTSKEEVSKFVGKRFEDGDCIIVKVD